MFSTVCVVRDPGGLQLQPALWGLQRHRRPRQLFLKGVTWLQAATFSVGVRSGTSTSAPDDLRRNPPAHRRCFRRTYEVRDSLFIPLWCLVYDRAHGLVLGRSDAIDAAAKACPAATRPRRLQASWMKSCRRGFCVPLGRSTCRRHRSAHRSASPASQRAFVGKRIGFGRTDTHTRWS
jgi:hypothetical protein